jgi:hypothetical protein
MGGNHEAQGYVDIVVTYQEDIAECNMYLDNFVSICRLLVSHSYLT